MSVTLRSRMEAALMEQGPGSPEPDPVACVRLRRQPVVCEPAGQEAPFADVPPRVM